MKTTIVTMKCDHCGVEAPLEQAHGFWVRVGAFGYHQESDRHYCTNECARIALLNEHLLEEITHMLWVAKRPAPP